MTTKTLIEVEVPEGGKILHAAIESAEGYYLQQGFRLVPPAREVPDALLDRIEEALRRFVSGGAARRIPADETDGDLVLYDLRQVRAGKPMKWAREESTHPAEPARAAGGEREAFEKWFDAESVIHPHYSGAAWLAWQARALLAAAPAEGK